MLKLRINTFYHFMPYIFFKKTFNSTEDKSQRPRLIRTIHIQYIFFTSTFSFVIFKNKPHVKEGRDMGFNITHIHVVCWQ